MKKLALVAALTLLSCGKNGTYVLVTVDSGTPLTLTSLEVKVTNAGQSVNVPVTTGSPFTIPPVQSFVLQLGPTRMGDITVEVHALAASGEVAQTKGTTKLVPGGQTTLALTLTPALADMGSGDGNSDLAGVDMVRLLGFAPAATYPVGNGGFPCSVAIADFTGDGKQDLAVAVCVDDVGAGNYIRLLHGDGNGTFQAAATVLGAGDPGAIVAADLNGDGKQDLAFAQQTSNIGVVLGNGDGTFQAAMNLAVGATPSGIGTGDFNSDQHEDLVVSNSGSGAVSMLLGNGGGLFSPAVNYTVGGSPSTILAAKFDNDQKLDVATWDLFAGTSVLIGNGDGTLQMPLASPSVVGMVASDLNGDGKADLAGVTGNAVVVALSKGDGTFQASTTQQVSANAVAAADLDGDGIPDLALSDGANGLVAVMRGRGDGTFQPPMIFNVAKGARFVAIGDFTGDGRPDIAIVHPGGVGILINRSQ